MLSCKQASRLASEALDRRLPLRSRIGLRMHLLVCSACRTVSRQMQALDAMIRSRFEDEADSFHESALPDSVSPERLRSALHEALDRTEWPDSTDST